MERIVAQRQMRDFGRLFNSLTERCFTSCVDDFTSRALTTKESECTDKCLTKFMKHSERVGARFQEENLRMVRADERCSRLAYCTDRQMMFTHILTTDATTAAIKAGQRQSQRTRVRGSRGCRACHHCSDFLRWNFNLFPDVNTPERG